MSILSVKQFRLFLKALCLCFLVLLGSQLHAVDQIVQDDSATETLTEGITALNTQTICLDNYEIINNECPAGISNDLCELFKTADDESNDSVKKISENCIEVDESIAVTDVTEVTEEVIDGETEESEDSEGTIGEEDLDYISQQLVQSAFEDHDLNAILGQTADAEEVLNGFNSPQNGYIDYSAGQANNTAADNSSGAFNQNSADSLMPMLSQILQQNGYDPQSGYGFPGLSDAAQQYIGNAQFANAKASNIVTQLALDNDGVTPPPFKDPHYQSQTSLPGLDAGRDNFIVFPVKDRHNYPLKSVVRLTNLNSGVVQYAIVGDYGPPANNPLRPGGKLEMSRKLATAMGAWKQGMGDEVINQAIRVDYIG